MKLNYAENFEEGKKEAVDKGEEVYREAGAIGQYDRKMVGEGFETGVHWQANNELPNPGNTPDEEHRYPQTGRSMGFYRSRFLNALSHWNIAKDKIEKLEAELREFKGDPDTCEHDWDHQKNKNICHDCERIS